MSFPECAITLDELKTSIDTFVQEECERTNDHLAHKNCGGAIRTGFLDLFYLNNNGTLDLGHDGFGIGPKSVPYCERCFPPDGHNYTYAVRFPILRAVQREPGFAFTWGRNRNSREEIVVKDEPLLLK